MKPKMNPTNFLIMNNNDKTPEVVDIFYNFFNMLRDIVDNRIKRLEDEIELLKAQVQSQKVLNNLNRDENALANKAYLESLIPNNDEPKQENKSYFIKSKVKFPSDWQPILSGGTLHVLSQRVRNKTFTISTGLLRRLRLSNDEYKKVILELNPNLK